MWLRSIKVEQKMCCAVLLLLVQIRKESSMTILRFNSKSLTIMVNVNIIIMGSILYSIALQIKCNKIDHKTLVNSLNTQALQKSPQRNLIVFLPISFKFSCLNGNL